MKTKNWYSGTPISSPPYSTIHAIPCFLIGIICGPIWGSFAVLGSFADPYSTGLGYCYS